MNKNKQNLRDLGDTIKDINKCIIEASEREEIEKEVEKYLRKNSPKLPKCDEKHNLVYTRISTNSK